MLDVLAYINKYLDFAMLENELTTLYTHSAVCPRLRSLSKLPFSLFSPFTSSLISCQQLACVLSFLFSCSAFSMSKCPKLAFCLPSLRVLSKMKLMWMKWLSPEPSQKTQTGKSHRRQQPRGQHSFQCTHGLLLQFLPPTITSALSPLRLNCLLFLHFSPRPRLKSWPVHHGHGCSSSPALFFIT